MDRITQESYYRQRFVKYAQEKSVTEASQRYKISRKTIYKWINRYDGSVESLRERSHRPKRSPNSHTEDELRKIRKRLKRHRWKDLILAYQELVERDGYTRSYGGFKRIARKLQEAKPKRKKKKRKNKPYQRAEYPGQKVQIDVKYVPSECVVNGEKYYQYTAVDECSRWAYREIYDEHSTYSSYLFLMNLLKCCPFPIREIQTDNGTEFTNALLVTKSTHKTMFENAMDEAEILYHRIRIATPRHNGKVERQHRLDGERFYSQLRMFSLEDGRKQLAAYQAKSNEYMKQCLGMRSPDQVVAQYLGVM